MSARKRKSRKRSDSAKLPEVHFFVDRALGRHIVPHLLREAGLIVTAHHETGLADDSPDDEWFKLCGQNGWIGLTKDRFLASQRNLQFSQIMEAGASVYFLKKAHLVGDVQAQAFIRASAKMIRIARSGTPPPPFIGNVTEFGKARIEWTRQRWEARRRN